MSIRQAPKVMARSTRHRFTPTWVAVAALVSAGVFSLSSGCAIDLGTQPYDALAAAEQHIENDGLPKKGFSGGSCADLATITASYPDFRYYNWGTRTSCGDVDRYVPMMWGDEGYEGRIANVIHTLSQQEPSRRFVLGPNECDHPDQCGLSPRRVAQLWKRMHDDIVAAGLGDTRFIFAVPTDGGATQGDWVWSVIGMYRHLYGALPPIDRFAWHHYGRDTTGDPAASLKLFIRDETAKIDVGSSRVDGRGPCAAAVEGGTDCSFDSRTFMDYDGERLESITANGRAYNYQDGEPWANNGMLLTSVTRYAASNGPCAGRNGADCKLDSRAVSTDRNGRRIESITAYGRYYNFTNGAPWSSNGSLLTGVARYVAENGPCAGHTGADCVFDSRTVSTDSRGHVIESISAYGRYYNFDNGAPWASNGSLQTSVARYVAADGPCAGRTGTDCRFESRTLARDATGKITESITAYGRHFNFTDGAPWPGNGSSLASVARYDDRIYYQGAHYAGTHAWLTEFGPSCWASDSDEENLAFMRSAIPFLEAEPRLDHYNWFTTRISGEDWWALGWESCSLIDHPGDALSPLGIEYARTGG